MTLIVGGTGATGQWLVSEMLERGEQVKLIARAGSAFPEELENDPNLTVIRASLLDLSDTEIAQLVKGCSAIASCLGHRKLYGKPRKLVTDAVRRLCLAVLAEGPSAPVKFVLMNTTGNRNRDLVEPISSAEKIVQGLLRALIPPHSDNEQAADYLRSQIGQNHDTIEWVAVRPDTLTNDSTVTAYDVVPSPTRSAIFNAGKTSRINVGHFMAELILNDSTWSKWKGQMPVIYNEGFAADSGR